MLLATVLVNASLRERCCGGARYSIQRKGLKDGYFLFSDHTIESGKNTIYGGKGESLCKGRQFITL